MNARALFDDVRGAEHYVSESISGASRETDRADFDVPAIARALRDLAGSWCAIPRLEPAVFWQIVQEHALPSCPPWCEASDHQRHWTPIRDGHEAIHERHFGPRVTVNAWHGQVDGGDEWSAPIVAVKHHRVGAVDESLFTVEQLGDLAQHFAASPDFAHTLPTA